MWIFFLWFVESLGMILCVFYKGCIGGYELGLCFFFFFKFFNKFLEYVILFLFLWFIGCLVGICCRLDFFLRL